MSVAFKAGIKWLPETYRAYKSYIQYFSPDEPIFTQLAQQKHIVSHFRILSARKQIQQCQLGKMQFLHMGDCAEPFEHSAVNILNQKTMFFKQCKQILEMRKKKKVTMIGRIAGQYAKPRSTQFVTINGTKVHNYKGDNVNTENNRNPSNNRLMQGYHRSLFTAEHLMKQFPQLLYSHEGLIVPYQAALTQNIQDKYYCTSAHMLWIGERTRQLDGAHVQFFRGIQNPIGIKISTKITTDQFHQLVQTLNPNNEMGKLIVIIRMGKDLISSKLDQLIALKKKQGLNFLFVTDPMHGNTYQSPTKSLKTRNLSDILSQINYFQQRMLTNKLPYGYSLQSTYQNVTQCHGLAEPLTQSQLNKNTYTSKCDPRLNNAQTKKLLSILSQQ